MARAEHEPVAERQPRPPHVPAHRPAEHQRQKHVDLGSGAARVAALAVIERQIDALIDQILDDLVAREIALRGAVQGIDAHGLSLQHHGSAIVHGPPTVSDMLAAVGPTPLTDAPVTSPLSQPRANTWIRHPERSAALLAILIGFASVFSAVLAWQASLASIDASRFQSLAVQQ